MQKLFFVFTFLINLSLCGQSNEPNSSILESRLRIGVPIAVGAVTYKIYQLKNPMVNTFSCGLLNWYEQEKYTLKKLHTGLTKSDSELDLIKPKYKAFDCLDNLELCVFTKGFINMYDLKKQKIKRDPHGRYVYRFPESLHNVNKVWYTKEELVQKIEARQVDVDKWFSKEQSKHQAEVNRINKLKLRGLSYAAAAGLGSFVLLSCLTKK